MGNYNVMGLGGGVPAAIIVATILFFTASQSCAAGNATNIANFHIDPDALFFHHDPELVSAAADPATSDTLKASYVPFGCGRPGYRACVPNPQNSKKGEHCAAGPGGTYLPRNCGS